MTALIQPVGQHVEIGLLQDQKIVTMETREIQTDVMVIVQLSLAGIVLQGLVCQIAMILFMLITYWSVMLIRLAASSAGRGMNVFRINAF